MFALFWGRRAMKFLSTLLRGPFFSRLKEMTYFAAAMPFEFGCFSCPEVVNRQFTERNRRTWRRGDEARTSEEVYGELRPLKFLSSNHKSVASIPKLCYFKFQGNFK